MKPSAAFSERELKRAVEWFVHLQSDLCQPEDQLRFEAWLSKNASHRAAYLEAERVWANMDALKFMPVPGLDEARSAKSRQSTTVRLSSFALLVLSTALLVGAWREYSAETVYYHTQIGERLRVELADDSHIDLNTNTRVAVRLSLLKRNVQLMQGEALFDISHSRLRPFSVQAGDLQVRDIGTRFNIRKQGQGATISVFEGEVELNDGQNVFSEHLFAGSQRDYSESKGLGQLESVDSEKLIAWVNGQLVFKQTPLREVTAELERYHPVQFSFSDAELAKESISGTFNADDLNPFLHALQHILPIQAKRNGERVQLRRIVHK